MISEKEIWQSLEEVKDPEIPVLSIVELGMVTSVEKTDNHFIIKFIPTYSACPATTFIKNQIEKHLKESFRTETFQLLVDEKIIWETSRMSKSAKEKLKEFKISPPQNVSEKEMFIGVECPHCKSTSTVLKSVFGSTLCRGIQYCNDCKQSFEMFKPLVL
jgi:ring-1,2-phenylacetyl-CoA epoxidase subunit PaaD